MKQDTLIVTAGRDPEANHGAVNPPVYHVSTILFPSVAALEAAQSNRTDNDSTYYGRFGTPTTFAFQNAVAEIDGGHRAIAVASGKCAILVALTAFLKSGDHLLMVDTAYGPTRALCDGFLTKFGVTTTYYDPLIGPQISNLIRSETRVIFTESPGSQTFEIQDIDAIAEAAHSRGCVVLLDNTWATPLFFRPFDHGVDVAIQAATKYIVGHSDAMLGVITTTESTFGRVQRAALDFGAAPGPDDVYLGQRGLRTLSVRLNRHMKTGLAVAEWLKTQTQIARVLHPGLPDGPGHSLWLRDFRGASGLFGLVLQPTSKNALAAMLDGMELFKMGYSWGGYESLIIPTDPRKHRTATTWDPPGPTLRIHTGLEDPDDLINDLERGLARLDSNPKG
ncbi:MAG: Cystathionine beta-lyase MetC [Alphaproteobacteria bacterium MarineAlpha9_Bin7]|nr:MAG: Cystathionine beta-lyase MetC [Alphaproteobacteria bacterium MarineAlpha9_Bin7]